MDTNRYIEEANSTVPPSLHTKAIPQNVLANGLQGVADAAEALNAVKKLLVYGPDKRPLPDDSPLRTGEYVKDTPTDTGDMPEEVLHGIIGLLTESGELAELALTSIVGRDKPFDRANLREELGDKFWYVARILKRMQQLHPDEDWSFEAIMGENAAKLAVRHKSKPGETFNPDAGGEEGRDREAEKAAMQSAEKLPQKNYKGEEIPR
jgi:NTP pyrophosphatase (non-canonical NTP hydrolase)